MADLTKKDVENIVKDEIDKFINKKFKDEFVKQIKSTTGQGRKEILELVKNALEELYKYMWIRRSVWKNEIR
jgi:hypothetical protein